VFSVQLSIAASSEFHRAEHDVCGTIGTFLSHIGHPDSDVIPNDECMGSG